MTTKVKLRQKRISENRFTLYLDFYPAIPHPETGKPTRREFLGKYLHAPIKFLKRKGNSGVVKEIPVYHTDRIINATYEKSNLETLQVAEAIRYKRQSNLDKPEIYSGYELEQLKIKEQGEKNFVEYFKALVDKREDDNWKSCYNYLNKFTNGSMKFADLNEKFCDDFKEYLLTTKSEKRVTPKLVNNSAASYFMKFKSALKNAYRYGYLRTDLNAKIEEIKVEEVVKQTLTLEELNVLAKTDCPNPLLKKAALFIALTGMPFKEMQNLVWGEIEVSELFGFRVFTSRQKTNHSYLPNISEQSFSLLGERKDPDEKVFEGLSDKDRYQDFRIWLAAAGIKKKMTFHDLRHTYGSLQIDLDTDPYTLQGNMGHATIAQTLKYGKRSDRKKRIAAEKIKLDI